ncbi:MAG: I78 family peptidase inhibitor [Paenirhodobacter sp.]|uniref:I78 family peptidase inhibitor n=1 Tax=Paenirhodobacter sp. TaxID=1965326 RepID=UPI003D0FB9D1
MRAFSAAPALIGALLLASCTLDAAGPDLAGSELPVPGAADQCGATELGALVGQPESVLATMRFAQRVRVIHPGDAVTMDYSASRLNIGIDAAGKIATLHCG